MSDEVTVTVVRSSDSSQDELNISLSDSVDTLKDKISKTKLGPIDRKHQRLFHLGKELKVGRRSLSNLGFGRFQNFIVHLHSLQPKTFELLSDDEEEDSDVVIEVVKSKRVIAGSKRGVVEDLEVVSQSNIQHQVVVDLLDDDSDEESEEVQEISVINPSTESKRVRRF